VSFAAGLIIADQETQVVQQKTQQLSTEKCTFVTIGGNVEELEEDALAPLCSCFISS
jgi:hypothetical protein